MKNQATIRTLYLKIGNLTKIFRTAFLIPVCSFLLIFSGCATAQYGELKPAGSVKFEIKKFKLNGMEKDKILFKTGIDVYGRHLSGIMFVKNLGDSHYRIVFITEVGMGVFDFELDHGVFTDHGSLDFIKRKMVMKTLQKDLRLMLMEDNDSSAAEIFIEQFSKRKVYKYKAGNDFNYYFTDENDRLVSIENSSSSYKNVKLDYLYSDKNVLQRIIITHYNIDLKMEFIQLENVGDNE